MASADNRVQRAATANREGGGIDHRRGRLAPGEAMGLVRMGADYISAIAAPC
jgi:hypothetical protein